MPAGSNFVLPNCTSPAAALALFVAGLVVAGVVACAASGFFASLPAFGRVVTNAPRTSSSCGDAGCCSCAREDATANDASATDETASVARNLDRIFKLPSKQREEVFGAGSARVRAFAFASVV